MNNISIETLANKIKDMANTAKFVSFTYRSKKANELARHTIILGATYKGILERSKLALELLPISEIMELGISNELAIQAKDKVLASLTKSIVAHANGEQNEDYTKIGQYIPLGNGLSINSTDGSFQLFGLAHAKMVIEPGEYKEVKSRPLTIAQNKIKELLPISKFREFALDYNVIQSARMNGETLELN